MKCPVCGNYSPDSMTQCQFCSTPLTPVSVPVQPVQPVQPAQTVPQQPLYSPQPAIYTQPVVQAITPIMQQPQPQQPGAAMPQYGYSAPQASPYGIKPAQPQYAAPQTQYSYTPAAAAVSSPYAQSALTAAQAPVSAQPAAAAAQTEQTAEAEKQQPPEEVDERTATKGTLIALLVWFLILGAAIASVYFSLPSKIAALLGAKGNEPVSASDAMYYTDEFTEDGTSQEVQQVQNDPLYGTWALCTYYIQNLSDSSISGGSHITNKTPLQFYTFNNGSFDRFEGASSKSLSHTLGSYVYTDGAYVGPLLSGGSSEPVVVLSSPYMCVYDTYMIDGVNSYVEYALTRVFEEPASDASIQVYAEALESGTISLPQYTSTVMVGGTTETTTTAAPNTSVATYNLLGTWLLISRDFAENGLVESIENGKLDYIYTVFSLDGSFSRHTLVFDDEMEECLSRDTESDEFDYSDGLLDLPPNSGISVTMGDKTMYFDYIDKDGMHIRDTYMFISSDEYSSKELAELRPEINGTNE